ncbi:MAG: hypothetical protein A2157_15065 [Deltaproteobacteria bacterium RBG_16_47_11]|nr:MAG: hypothetical protein A2157_15065 [Deltaproteobacteria bacterium RBG_16_47_11]
MIKLSNNVELFVNRKNPSSLISLFPRHHLSVSPTLSFPYALSPHLRVSVSSFLFTPSPLLRVSLSPSPLGERVGVRGTLYVISVQGEVAAGLQPASTVFFIKLTLEPLDPRILEPYCDL